MLIGDFYRLLLLTRRRHGLPPQPLAWFRNLITCMGESMKIRVAYKGDEAIASIITLRFKRSLVYKYGCSNEAHHNLGGMQMLFWHAIQEAIENGLSLFDLGRSEISNEGLATFKNRWGATRSLLPYWTTPLSSKGSARGWKAALAGKIFAHIPDRLLMASGQLMYRHFG
jgi:CelD/BcsL family acetyltransferase involved in cellulose biosynthesis